MAGAALLAGALAPGGVVVGGRRGFAGGGFTRVGIAPALVEGRYKAMQARVASLLRDAAQKGDWTTVSAGQVQSIVEEFSLRNSIRLDRVTPTDLRQISSRGHAHARRQDGGDERPDVSEEHS